ncbi:3-dehydroquinate synthase [Nocardioides sp. HDW12B]|uniref:3-dehydroquinate synthase n=1 Tax=Nocardioides sp. HDW12B TaxID=2714939 RepID=UPI00140C6F27|nr:3-dehydroquinate synthase [Nocardioides sp. HDW12B]QIK66621.1 3-dehydroquinate synthase [Nocardioides sp. HDW12B]
MSDSATLAVGGPGSQAGPYDVVVGHDLRHHLDGLVAGVRRVAVIHPRTLADRAEGLRAHLAGLGLDAHAIEVPDGEEAKDARVLAFCWQVLGSSGFTRSDLVVTFGGGSTTDLGGFVAASWLRGVRVVHVPTTLLAMVDAAVGGKTGINTAEGKNLVGAFHEPAGVLCDLDLLETLPRAELVSGLAEVVKCGFIADPVILDVVERAPEASVTPGSRELRELVERAIQVKIDVVSGDLRESARAAGGHPGREALNYGHTLAHAIERAEHYRMRHGDAVSLGMVFVAELAHLSERLDDATAERHRSVLELVGLPTTYGGASFEDLLATMRIDKKTRGDLLRFVVLEGLGRPVVLEGPTEPVLREAFGAVSERRSRFPFFRD